MPARALPLLAVVLASALLAACAGEPATPPASGLAPCAGAPAFTGSQLFTLRHDGTERRYILHLPPSAHPGQRLPLVLGLHGTGGKGGFFEQQSGMSKVADREGFAAVYPYALGDPSRWTLPRQEGPDDLDFARALIAEIGQRACIAPGRISAFGHSNGGGFAVALACDPAIDLSAAISASGAYGAPERCTSDPPPPLLELHGDADEIVPYGPARAFLDTWARWAGCEGRPATGPGPDGTRRERWRGCADGAALEHLRRPGGTHDLPASAAPAAGAFLARVARG